MIEEIRGKQSFSTDICTLPCVQERASGTPPYGAGTSARCSVMTDWRDDGGEAQQGRDVCAHTADSHCCVADANVAP